MKIIQYHIFFSEKAAGFSKTGIKISMLVRVTKQRNNPEKPVVILYELGV